MITLYAKLKHYIAQFNAVDHELYRNSIPNQQAAQFLQEQIPLLDCPDPQIEEVYYFRWWTFRKHIRQTTNGYVITEFLPDVPWSGSENAIVCPACLQIREGRWLKDADIIIRAYIRFWLQENEHVLDYSSWLPAAVWEYCRHQNDPQFAKECLPSLVLFFEKRAQRHRRKCGLYWQDDNRDGMEYSISGPGLRPTLNSYAWADAVAIAEIAQIAGNAELHAHFSHIAQDILSAMERLLWDGHFFRTIPLTQSEDLTFSSRPAVDAAHDARELIGFIPWYFSLPGQDTPSPFGLLTDPNVFYAPFGLTTADQQHPRFMENHPHECLWNGPVWPFATSQVLVAAANLLRKYPATAFSKEDYFNLLKQYAISHRLTTGDGKTVPWIDENLHPFTGRWLARDELQRFPEKVAEVGPERGKDYNHSLYCDLILSGLLGIQAENGNLTAHPLIPDDWNWFRVENLWVDGRRWKIIFDRDGSHYGEGSGLHIAQDSESLP